ncbi:ABC transporter permease [Marinoscillum pacificum]|uniref:ABC transporter permease n=1 Tax=Marinoscillum pacificum TaxID=392723 RepID=UPI002158420C|nr:ABC transporter permease [Marinoscillum pacificum]
MIKRFADRLLKWYCHPDYYSDISGDLEEIYLRNLDDEISYAGWRHFIQVILLFRPSLLKDFGQDSILKDTGMLKNYFKISVRNLMRHKTYTAINVIGLAVGLAAFLLINQYVTYERSYDSHHRDADQIYRLTTDMIVDGVLGTRDAMSYNPSGKVLTEGFEEIQEYTLTYNNGGLNTRKDEELVRETEVKMVDEHFVDFFGFDVLAGHSETMLKDPFSLVLTKEKAKFYFGDEDPIGKTIHVFSGFDRPFKVTGIIDEIPRNTHYKFTVLMSISSIQDRLDAEGWRAFNYYTYLRLKPGTNVADLQERMIPVKETHLGKNPLFFNLQPIQEIHLKSEMTYEPETPGSAKSVNFLEIISIFILAIAWVNYVNLSTAKAVDRAKEVGLRKVIGARKVQIRGQFLLESFLINFMGALLALIAAELAVPFFNQLIGEEILGNLILNHSFLIKLGIFALIGTLVSGFYPALFLSNFGIVTVLKGKFRTSKNGIFLRKALVVGQFAASLILIAGTFIVIQQVDYMRTADIGMNTEQVVGFRNPRFGNVSFEVVQDRLKSFHNQLRSNPNILGIATTNSLPGGKSNEIGSTSGDSRIVGLTEPVQSTTYIHNVDDAYFSLLDIEILEGRNFNAKMASDSSAVILNETFVKRAGLKLGDEIINQKLMFGDDPENEKYTIIGVIKDANRSSLQMGVEPTAYFFQPFLSRSMVKLSGNNVRETVAFVENTWKEFFPNSALDYAFLDDRFDQLYANDKRFGAVFGAFSGFALLVAILGLFGLSSFMASQRTKEVGVRKVLGASIPHIVSIFYKEFLILIGVAALIGLPTVFFTMSGWLSNYAYRIDFPWIVLVLAIVVLLVSAFLTVGYQVWRVAVLNPAKTLKYE